MLSPIRTVSTLGLALALTAATNSAQAVQPPELIYPTIPVTQTRHVTYHWSSQRITSDTMRPVVDANAAVAGPCFDNSYSPYVWSLFNLIMDEIVDWGVKTCGDTDVVTSFTFAYNTRALDPNLGGPGAAMTFSLYEGTNGFGHLGTQVASFAFTGLPGSPVAGQPSPWPIYITVDLSDAPILVPDGNLGWGYMNDDNRSGPLLAFAPNAALGTRDALDVYTPGPATNGHYTGTFNWAGSYLGSFYFQLEEADGSVVANSTVVNGTGVNPMLLTELSPPVLGTNWLGRVDMSGYPASPASVIVFSTTAIPPFLTGWGEALVDPNAMGTILDIGYTLHSMPLPLVPDLAGYVVHTQGALFLGNGQLVLTNGVDLSLGW